MDSLLRHQGHKIFGDDQQTYSFVISISTGELSFDKIVEWLKNNNETL